MDANGFCNYVHMDKEKAKKKQGAKVKIAKKRPSDGSVRRHVREKAAEWVRARAPPAGGAERVSGG